MEQLPNAIVILGGTGDLSRRKLIPALENLYKRGELSKDSVIIGSGRRALSIDEFRDKFNLNSPIRNNIFYYQGTPGLKRYIDSLGKFRRIIIFLSLPPATYVKTVNELAPEGFGDDTILIVEKPFGRDYESARDLNKNLTHNFLETQIFRSDHYLAKEAVQNLLVFRFANRIFEPSWNNRYVESIQISAYEELMVEERGEYFDSSGILRDMVQNHLFQLLCLSTMEPPPTLDAEDIRNQKINILKCLRVDEVHRSQYIGYRESPGVAPDSNTETYVEMKLHIDNFRWAGVPIYIRTGKAMARRGTEIGIKYKALPKILFNDDNKVSSNQIIIKVQPSEGIILELANKIPGMETSIGTTNMAFCYRDAFANVIPEAYQKLLADALNGDRTLFVSANETETSWKLLEPFLDKGELTFYESGKPPESPYSEVWIDFEKYKGIC